VEEETILAQLPEDVPSAHRQAIVAGARQAARQAVKFARECLIEPSRRLIDRASERD
jgi:hypothetical protein